MGLQKKDKIQESEIIVDLNLIEPTEGVYFSMTVGAFFSLLNTWYATLTGKPVMVCSATIGPYNNLLKSLARFVLNKVNIITLREEFSNDYLKELGVNKPAIHVSADLAFLLEPDESNGVNYVFKSLNIDPKEKPLIGIAPTAMMHPSVNRAQYIQLITELSDYLINNLNATIVFIAHTYQDLSITQEIYHIINAKNKVRLLTDNFSASEIKTVIGNCDLFIASRFHALVASTSLGVPSLGTVSYSKGKFHGIIGEMMGQDDYLLDIDDNFDYSAFLAELKSKASELWLNKPSIAEELKRREKIMIEQALLNGKLIKEFLIPNTSLI